MGGTMGDSRMHRIFTIAAIIAALALSTVAGAQSVTRTVTLDSGRVVEFFDNGDRRITEPDGTVRLISTRGFEQVTDSGGNRVTTFADGTVVRESTLGAVHILRPDGSWSIQDGDTRTHGYPDGTSVKFSPDGTKTTTNPDGSTRVEHPDGSITSTPPPTSGGGDGDSPPADDGGSDSGGGSGDTTPGGDGGSDKPEPPTDAPTLEPGSGFIGLISPPGAVGDPADPGFDAKAIARWDVVPFQSFDGIFEVGVVAFHKTGIASVEFSVDGGPWLAVESMTLNPRTGVEEYWVNLDASLFDQPGDVEVRAIAWPNTGKPRVLQGALTTDTSMTSMHSLTLHANPGGAENREIRYVSTSGHDADGDGSLSRPYRTISHAMFMTGDAERDSSFATIKLLPGTYQLGEHTFSNRSTSTKGWVTIEPFDPASGGEVIINGSVNSFGVNTHKLRLRNLVIRNDGSTPIITPNKFDTMLWFDGTTLIGAGQHRVGSFSGGFDYVYLTDSYISDSMNGVTGLITRNVLMERIGQDAFSQPAMILNTKVETIDRGPMTDWHADAIQFFRSGYTYDNVIFFGVEIYNANSQGIFVAGVEGLTNTAFVNFAIDLVGGTPTSQWDTPLVDHVLMWNVTHLGGSWLLRENKVSHSTYRDVSVIGSVFHGFSDDAGVIDGLTFNGVHCVRGDLDSQGATSGDPLFVTNTDGFRFALGAGSPLLDRVGRHPIRFSDPHPRVDGNADIGAWGPRPRE